LRVIVVAPGLLFNLVLHAEALEAIYEEDFLGFSYGFRPGRGQHDALDALHAGILRKQVNWVLDADIRGFLDRDSYCPPAYAV
jgi:retron-type reverse transcriptase